MRSRYWKVALSLVVYVAFIYTAQQAPAATGSSGNMFHKILFTDSSFFLVFPLVFILNAPQIYSKNPMYLIRLQDKAGVFWYGMRKMVLYSLAYVLVVTLFVIISSLLVNAGLSAFVILNSFITSILSSLILAGLIVVGSMYIRHSYTIIVVYSVILWLIVMHYTVYGYFAAFDFIYIGMSLSRGLLGLYAGVYAGYFGLIGVLYFLYDIQGKRDLI